MENYKVINFFNFYLYCALPLTLLVGRQEGHPVCKKTEWWDAGMVMCLGQCADLHIAQLMPRHGMLSYPTKAL